MRAKLAVFKAERGHCRVTKKDDAKLYGWLSKQRRFKKWLDAGQPNQKGGITVKRVAKLEALGALT